MEECSGMCVTISAWVSSTAFVKFRHFLSYAARRLVEWSHHHRQIAPSRGLIYHVCFQSHRNRSVALRYKQIDLHFSSLVRHLPWPDSLSLSLALSPGCHLATEEQHISLLSMKTSLRALSCPPPSPPTPASASPLPPPASPLPPPSQNTARSDMM